MHITDNPDFSSSMNDIVVAVDIGGSHITSAPVCLVEARAMDEKAYRTTVNSKGSREEILGGWLEALEKVFSSFPTRPWRLALAMPGPFDYQNGISLIRNLDKYEDLFGVNVKDELSKRLRIAPDNVLLRNDAEAFLHGEIATGLASEEDSVLGITLGTGFGAALSKHGVTKDLNLGGEVYGESIADDYFTTRWFLGRFEEHTGDEVLGVEVLADLVGSNPKAALIFEEFGRALSNFLVPHILSYQIDTLVIGGNIGKAHRLFLPLLKQELASQNVDIRIKLAKQGEQSAIIGAACLFKKIEVEKPKQ